MATSICTINRQYSLNSQLAEVAPIAASASERVLQTTLLGLAIAIILALLAALVGPLLIDLGNYRSLFEAEAHRLTGVKIRVTGAIDARLLPSPRLTLHDLTVGDGDGAIRVRSLDVNSPLAH